MKNPLITVFRMSIMVILAAKILNWFLHFSDETNRVLNIIMFSLIGTAYLVMGFKLENRLKRIIIMTCGIALIILNFFETNSIVSIAGILCILVPMLIARFNPDEQPINAK